MKFFSLLSEKAILAPRDKVLSPEDFSIAVEAQELLSTVRKDAANYRSQVEEECKRLRLEAKDLGFNEGMQKWSEQLAFLDKEIRQTHETVKTALIRLAIASIKKIIGKELESAPETILSLITNALKTVTQSKRVVIFVNPKDLEIVEAGRGEFKKILENTDVLILSPKDEISIGGCVIETEGGVVDAQLEVQLNALEKAFKDVLQNSADKGS